MTPGRIIVAVVCALCIGGCTGGHPTIPRAGLLLWLKSDAGVTLNGSHVSRWVDQSGNGNDAIQLDAPRQPLLVNGELNGKPVIHFDGIDDRLGLTGSKHMSRISLFIVFEMDSGSDANPIVFGDIDANGRVWGINLDRNLLGFSSDTVNVFAGVHAAAHGCSPKCATSGQWHSYSVVTDGAIWSTTFRAAGMEGQMSHDGNNMSIDVPLGNSLGIGVGGIGGTDGVRAPIYRTATRCSVAELILYDVILSDVSRRAVEGYLAERYNLPPPAAGRK